jgi:hypothetical protein
VTPTFSAFRPARTPARRLRRGAASSFVVGSREGPDSSRCRIPSPSSTAFNRASLHPPAPARHGDHPGVIYRRPPTSCAHRLRKPDRTSELLALSVARTTPGSRDPPAPLRHLPCQARRCRRRFRTTAIGRTRTPSVGSTRTLQPERARHRERFTRVASPRTLSLAASLGLPRQRPTGRLELPRAITCHPAVAGIATRDATRKMRLTDFCNRLPSRAPCGSLDSRPRSSRRDARRVTLVSTYPPWARAGGRRDPGRSTGPHAR